MAAEKRDVLCAAAGVFVVVICDDCGDGDGGFVAVGWLEEEEEEEGGRKEL